MTEAELFRVPVPNKTDSYSPVAHEEVVNEITKYADSQGIGIKNRYYNTNQKGTQVIGYFDIESHVPGFDYRVAFRNSYDKSMSLAFVAGASVMICSNGMIVGETQFVRKHTGEILSEMKQKIFTTFQDYQETMKRVREDSERMKQVQLDKTATAELCGRFFMEQDIITSSQLNIIRKELDSPSYEEFSDDNLWSLYNHTTHALKKTHPTNYLDKHKDLHEFVTNTCLV